ncbi:hypothetical protein L1987_12674 [Smallanthus sonchifolius]|uniref:Uncharacterized protein n=1 Tax=Smallanthus sonchifolius TaxID=185202 RepID=A0ACB9JGR9_9ASTR|nr:hypothetical protein L1987_12674 [Smallanthus sonchifolius]
MSPNDVMDKTVMLEQYNLPGMVIVEQGKEQSLGIGISNSADRHYAVFRFMDGNEGMLIVKATALGSGTMVVIRT